MVYQVKYAYVPLPHYLAQIGLCNGLKSIKVRLAAVIVFNRSNELVQICH